MENIIIIQKKDSIFATHGVDSRNLNHCTFRIASEKEYSEYMEKFKN